MEPICTEYQPGSFVMGAVDYPFWQQAEPWDGYLESYNPEYSNPFEDTSPESSFDGAMNWGDGCEQLYYTHEPVSPTAAPAHAHAPISPPVEAPKVIIPKPVGTPQPLPQEPPCSSINNPTPAPTPSPKRKRRAQQQQQQQQQDTPEASHTVEPKPKRVCRPRSLSSSFSPATLDMLANREDKDGSNDKEDVYLERSRVASNKFRERKRNEIALLESEEYNIEDANRQLRSMLDSLTSEILSLKMQILQHTHCNCELIQAYINKEAHHFVKNLQDVAKA